MTTTNLHHYHLVTRLQQQKQRRGDKIALRQWCEQGQHIDFTWQQAGAFSENLAEALLAEGVEVQENVAIFSHNSALWTLTDLAILQCRAIVVPLYATSSDDQAAYILNDAQVHILFVDGQKQAEIALSLLSLCPSLQKIIIMNPENTAIPSHPAVCTLRQFMNGHDGSYAAELRQRIADCSLDDLFTLIYTSGTTGEPKGVMLDYRNMAAQLYLHDERLTLTEDDVSLCFLPLTHVFERAWSFYVMHTGALNVYLSDTNLVRKAMVSVKPTVMCAVPRFYEKVFSGIYEKVAQAPWYKRALFHWAVRTGKKTLDAQQRGEKQSWLAARCDQFAQKKVLGKLRDVLGGNVRFLPAAGARLDDEIIRFFLAIGINIKYGYGMTETCATVSCWENSGYQLGSIGVPLPDVEVRIGEENEIQVRGPVVMRGYYNKPEETRQAFTADGWLRTGDAGALDEQGNLFITERLKDLMKTSNGKYIAPQMLEGTLGQDRFIEHIAVVADARKFVSALIVPCFDTLEEHARALNLKYHDRMELLKNSQIVALFESRLKELQKNIAAFHQVKRFTLLPQNFSMELGELTPTLKLRRKVIAQRYQREIESMYTD
ncbi:long-chain fatty acid--CoA ligase [Morganella morganii]|uniref:AMP-binding protein n=1 Tax=Morganella morganii TaxID=582 RepID=UPI0016494217|nr:long-chain fatty acid--CoA ligase [Morganella morganii]HCT3282241.1 long-chain fatty acid--CoA ligase [Morganella morganii]